MMALVCNPPQPSPIRFEFIDCTSISISYDIQGKANVSFTVISSDGNLSGNYTDLTFGGVRFQGYIMSVTIQPIVGTAVKEFRITLSAFGC